MEIAVLVKPSGRYLEGVLLCLLWASRLLCRDACFLITRRETEQQTTAAGPLRALLNLCPSAGQTLNFSCNLEADVWRSYAMCQDLNNLISDDQMAGCFVALGISPIASMHDPEILASRTKTGSYTPTVDSFDHLSSRDRIDCGRSSVRPQWYRPSSFDD